jgi:hypothetical protein
MSNPFRKGLVAKGLLMRELIVRGITKRNLIDQGNTERNPSTMNLTTLTMIRRWKISKRSLPSSYSKLEVKVRSQQHRRC